MAISSKMYIGQTLVSRAYIGSTLVYSGSTPSPTPTNKTLVITDVQETYLRDFEKSVGAVSQNYPSIFYYGSTFDEIEEGPDTEIFVYPPFSGGYENGVITITGPFENPTILSFGGNEGSPCNMIDNYQTVTFTGDTASVQADFSWETDHGCECGEQGGTWDGSECHFEEPEEPEEPDPCDGYSSQEECDCVNGGGTWDGEECHFAEPEEPDPCEDDPCSCDPNPDECRCAEQGGTWNGSECEYGE